MNIREKPRNPGFFLAPPGGGITRRNLFCRCFVVAIGAIDFVVRCNQLIRMWNFGDVVVAVSARPHFMVFNEKSAVRVMYLWPVRVARRRTVRVCMTFQAGFVVTQILGDNRCSKSQSHQAYEYG